MRSFLLAFTVFLSASVFALDSDLKTIITGIGRTNVWRNLKYPIFVDIMGKQINVDFRSEGVGKRWLAVTSKGDVPMTLIGIMKGDTLSVHAIETGPVNEETISILKLDAELAWEDIKGKLVANEAWLSAQAKENFATARPLAIAPNNMRLLHTGNLIEFHISLGHSDFLQAVIALGKKAEHGIPPEKAEGFMKAFDQFMKIDEPSNVTALRARLLKSQGKCAETVAGLTYNQILDSI